MAEFTISFNSPSPLPRELPSNPYVGREGIVEGDWKCKLLRFFLPGYAAKHDKEITEYFIEYFRKEFAAQEQPYRRERLQEVMHLSEQHIANAAGSSFETGRLEHYIHVARQRLNLENPSASACARHNSKLLDHWRKLGFDETAFWSSPDLVDFVFKSHLHRYITHPYYRHTIGSDWMISRRNGQVVPVKEPHLLLNGRMMPWSEIKKTLFVSSEGELYSMVDGQKRYWQYLDQGLTQTDRFNINQPHHLRIINPAPHSCVLELVTTHAHEEDYNILDRLLKGTRHAFFRIVFRNGFGQGFRDGGEYSFGWGTRWMNFSVSSPLSTLKGEWMSPDSFEFIKHDLCITPINITDSQALKVIELMRSRSAEMHPFHVVTANCCGISAETLSEAGIIDLQTKDHMAFMLYKFLIPGFIRKPMKKVGSCISCIIPDVILQWVDYLGKFLYSIIFAPIFSLLGAWRTQITYEEEPPNQPERNMVQASNQIKALFSNVFDLFSPSKMTFDLTKNIYKWQKRQPQTYYERRN